MASLLDESLNVSTRTATSQFFSGRWEELRDAALSVILVLFHFSLLRLWRFWHPAISSKALEESREEIFCKRVRACQKLGDATKVFLEYGEEAVQFSQAPSLLLRSFKLEACESSLWELYQATRDHFEYSRTMYSAVLSILCKSAVDRATEVLRDMILKDVEPDASHFGLVVRGHLSSGDLEGALSLLWQMQRQEMGDFSTFQAVLEVAVQRQLPVLAEEILQSMERFQVVASSTVACMVRLYGRRGDLGKAFQIFHEMPRKFGFKVDAHAFGSMLCVCAAEGEISDAFQVYEEMLAAGYEADTSAIKALLSGSLQQGDLDTAARLLHDSFSEGRPLPPPSVELFLLQAQRRGRRQLALPILEEALSAGLFVSQRIVNSLR